MALSSLQRDAVIAIADRRKGKIRPRDLIKAARNPAHPLNTLFEWNDQKAADRDRLATAYSIIRQVRIVVERSDYPGTWRVPLFSRDPDDEGGGYASLDYLRRDDTRARQSALMEIEKAVGSVKRAHVLACELGAGQDAKERLWNLVLQLADTSTVFGGMERPTRQNRGGAGRPRRPRA